jgi:hypothetical protein
MHSLQCVVDGTHDNFGVLPDSPLRNDVVPGFPRAIFDERQRHVKLFYT